MIIALMGNDGSGKTTIGKELHRILKETFFFKDVEYREEFNYFILKYIFRAFKKQISSARKEFLNRQNRQKRKIFYIWPYLVWIDQILAYCYYRIFKRHKILILDRYAYDFLMSWEHLGYSNWFVRWLYKHFPKPDIAIILWCDPQKAYERKKDTHSYPLEFYIAQTNKYLSFAKEMQIKTVDTSKDIKTTIFEILNMINKKLLNELKSEDKLLILLSLPEENAKNFEKELNNLEKSIRVLNWDYIIKTAIQCNVERIFFQNILRYYSTKISSKIKTKIHIILKETQNKVNLFVKTATLINEMFRKAGVEYAIMKTVAPFDYIFTDVDVIVKKDDFEKAQKLLSTLYPYVEAPKSHRAITFKNNKELLPIDLHYEVSWVGIRILDGTDVVKNKVKHDYNGVSIFVPSKDHELYILKSHDLYQHHYTTLGVFYWIQILSFGRVLVLPESPVTWHSIFYLLKPQNLEQVRDYIFYIYRWIRFKLNGKLPYNVVEVKI